MENFEYICSVNLDIVVKAATDFEARQEAVRAFIKLLKKEGVEVIDVEAE